MSEESNDQMFNEGIKRAHPPATWSEGLRAMWFDAKGNWQAAHNIAQDLKTQKGSWIHAYLHRKEGDDFNAGYWYQRAKRNYPGHGLEAEQKEIIMSLLSEMGSNP
ncbi:MAG: hypothetical protein E4H26_02715 [Flavobacteriales bacterium]|nr:MAG: hypothetical protein E4H26_02715 [Flavobacteriales bacterium]